MLFSVLINMLACGSADKSAELQNAKQLLATGEFSKANTVYAAIIQEDPQNVDAVIGASYVHLLAGEYDQAEKLLAAVTSSDASVANNILLRRAIIAVRKQDFETAQALAKQSNTDFGKILAAEIYLLDTETDEALELLDSVSASEHKKLVSNYIQLLRHESPWMQSLAESQAAWALRDYKLAVKSASGLLKKVQDDLPNYSEESLIWASRAIALGEAELAQDILNTPGLDIPSNLVWKKTAIEGMVLCLSGDISGGLSMIASLESVVSTAGMQNIYATTAVVMARKNLSSSALQEKLAGTAGAVALQQLGKMGDAKDVVDSGIFQKFLQGSL